MAGEDGRSAVLEREVIGSKKEVSGNSSPTSHILAASPSQSPDIPRPFRTAFTKELSGKSKLALPELSKDALQALSPEEYVTYTSSLLKEDNVTPLAKNIDIVLQQYSTWVYDESVLKSFDNKRKLTLGTEIAQVTETLMDTLGNSKEETVSPTILQDFYTLTINPLRSARTCKLLPALILLDEKNKKVYPNDSLRLLDDVKEKIGTFITHPRSSQELKVVQDMINGIFPSLSQDKKQEFFLYSLKKAESDETRVHVARMLGLKMRPLHVKHLLEVKAQEDPAFQSIATLVNRANRMWEYEPFSGAFDVGEVLQAEKYHHMYEVLDELPIDPSTRQTIEELKKVTLGNRLLARYVEVREKIEQSYERLTQSLAVLNGTEQISSLVRQNMVNQLHHLLQAVIPIDQNGNKTVFFQGELRTFHKREEIEAAMTSILKDANSFLASNSLNILNMSDIDKYLFQDKEAELQHQKPVKTLILESPDTEAFNANLITDGIIPNTDIGNYQKADNPFAKSNMARAKTYNLEEISWKITNETLPEMIIIDVPNLEKMTNGTTGDAEGHLLLWEKIQLLPPEKRPLVVMYCHDFSPPQHIRHRYEGFLYSSNFDELRNVVHLGRDMIALRDKDEAFRPEGLASRQEQQYDASKDLREWESITADTYQSLKHILQRIKIRNELFQTPYNLANVRDTSLRPMRPIKTILDCGTGEGRIAGMLARLGYNVVGLDISSELLKATQERLEKEGARLRGESSEQKLSYPALLRLKEEGLIAQDIILDDQKVREHFKTVQGNFFNLQDELNTFALDLRGHDPHFYEFFNENPWNMDGAYSSDDDIFREVGFDMAMFNWHTFCEIGDPANQREVLTQMLKVLAPGGELVIEIPDRMVDPYINPLTQYHKDHPDKPFGTLQDPLPDGKGYFSPRFFPDKNELVLLLKSVGYEVDGQQDVQTYLIENTDQTTGEKKLGVKEYFVTARRPIS